MSLLDHPIVTAFDTRLDDVADRLRGHRAADAVMYALSAAGDHGGLWHVVGLGRVVWPGDTIRDAIELSSALGVEAAIVNGPVKMLFRRERPDALHRPHHLRTPRTSSFPSGHASAGMFAAVLLADRTRWSTPWFVLGGAMGWSRVHVKIHHPSDVAGGMVVGVALGHAAVRVLARLHA